MFFEKPDVRYVDMCIYIDEHIYNGDYDQETVYQYLFHIIMMLSIKRNYFNSKKLTEDFSIYAASNYYMRLLDERQFEEKSPIEPIRSILNYIRKTLYSVRREYVSKYMPEQEVSADIEYLNLDSDAFDSYVSQKIDFMGKYEFGNYLESVAMIVKESLKSIPYKSNTPMWTNIYISCMLSLLNSVTLKNKDITRLNNFKRPNSLTDNLLNELYLNERYNSTILYHLDDNMYNYITVLTNKVRHKLAQELSQSLHTPSPAYITMKNLLMSNIIEQDYSQ
jgi:hypothetical protein